MKWSFTIPFIRLVDASVSVLAIPVQVGDFPLQLVANGTVTADHQVEIKVRSSSRIVEWPVVKGHICFEMGDRL